MSASLSKPPAWSAWQVSLHRHLHCVWCWQDLHIRRWFPEQWTSSLCPHHHEHLRQRIQQRHLHRTHGATSACASAQE